MPTAHDAADGVGFVIEHEGSRLAVLTDLGHPFAGLADTLASVDAAYPRVQLRPGHAGARPLSAPPQSPHPRGAGVISRTRRREPC